VSRTGSQLGPYRLGELLGTGGMGDVYAARHDQGGPPLALKILRSAKHTPRAQRFVTEAQIAARLRHPGIVPVVDAGEVEGTRYIAFHRVDGETLDALIPRLGREALLELLRQVAGALGHAHAQGVLHRDVKPQNVLVADGRAQLTDFGVARVEDGERLTVTGAIVGTLSHISPEAAQGRPLTPATDVWALGVILYQILSGGRLPFEGDSIYAALLATERASYPPLRPAPPPALARLLSDSLALDPKQRPRDGAEFAMRLAQGLEAGEQRRRSWVPFVAVAALLATGVVALVLVTRDELPVDPKPVEPVAERPPEPPQPPSAVAPQIDLAPYAALLEWAQEEALQPALEQEVAELALLALEELEGVDAPRADLTVGVAGMVLVALERSGKVRLAEPERIEDCLQRLERAARALEDRRERALAWATLGRIHTQRGRFDEGVRAFEQLEDLDPHWDASRGWHYRLEWAWCLESLHRFDEALRVHRQLRERGADGYETYVRLCEVHFRRNDFSEALKVAFATRERALELDTAAQARAMEWIASKSIGCRLQLGEYAYAQRDWDEFAGELRAAGAQVPPLWDLYQAEILLAQGQLRRAEAAIRAARPAQLRSWQAAKAATLLVRLGLALDPPARERAWKHALPLLHEPSSALPGLIARLADPEYLADHEPIALRDRPPGRFLDRKYTTSLLRAALSAPDRSHALEYAHEARKQLEATRPPTVPQYWELTALTLHALGDDAAELALLRGAVAAFPEDALLARYLERREAGERIRRER